MKEKLYRMISAVIKIIAGETIVNKPIQDFNKVLFYEKAQHLTFLFKKKIVYEASIWNNIKSHLFAGNIVFDIGGNIGQYALRFSESVGEKGKVVSFEPDYKNFAFLQFNVNINNCKNVKCESFGLGEKAEILQFFRDTETGGRMGSFNQVDVGSNYKGFNTFVSIETYHKMTEIHGIPDFVKIDVEGFELEVIKGVLDFSVKTKFLIEVRKESREQIFSIFTSHNFNCFVVDYDSPKLATALDQVPRFANLLFVKK